MGGDGRVVANRDQPADVPVRPMGEVPVIVRVQWADGTEEWRPARANRWTTSHVFVCWRDNPSDATTERYEWLRAGDVMRSVSWLVPPHRTPLPGRR
ncbi:MULTISPECIES: hypothetical protein [unclassified Actinotalea]|uniref:hypothetical protein n=1 Tax=unclassified Actinotalea TaxID=2638618 RepID=UPI002106BAF9|nr:MULTISPECIES: hypothetical protein [unclassified Actinotalea]